MVDSGKFIRNFNLHILCETELEHPYLSIFNYFENLFKYSNIYKGFDKGLLTYYVGENKDNIIFDYHPDSGILVSNYVLMYEYCINSHEITPFHLKKVMKWYIEYKFNLKKDIDIWYGHPFMIDNIGKYIKVEYINE